MELLELLELPIGSTFSVLGVRFRAGGRGRGSVLGACWERVGSHVGSVLGACWERVGSALEGVPWGASLRGLKIFHQNFMRMQVRMPRKRPWEQNETQPAKMSPIPVLKTSLGTK